MDKAMTRIEAALARIEAAGVSRPDDRSPGKADLALRAKVNEALEELDRLIAEMEA